MENKKFKKIKKTELNHIDLALVNETLKLCKLSPAIDKKVGAIIANHETGQIYSIGYNRMFEELRFTSCEDESGQSLPYVVHAEEHAIIEFLKNNIKNYNIKKLTIYCSYAPCISCAKYISHLGIKRIIYVEKHKTKFDMVKHSPFEFLSLMNVELIEVI